MTNPMVPTFAAGMVAHWLRLKARNARRDSRHHLVHEVRRGNMRSLFPDELNFSLSFDGVPIGNFIDTTARDLSEVVAPLPSLACTSGRMKTDADLKRAETKNRIGDNYWIFSSLEAQMLRGADRYFTYGFVPFFIEPDFECKMPYIRVENPRHSYYELDRRGHVSIYAHSFRKTVDELVAQFPEWTTAIVKDPKSNKDAQGDTELELIRWVDKTSVTMFVPSRDGLIVGSYQHKMKRAPVVIAERPSDEDEGSMGAARGQFDDVVWTQISRAIYASLGLEAAALSVQAPIAAPSDMDEFPVGPHAILQSDNAKDIHRVPLNVPAETFAMAQQLDQEMKDGARYPDARTGGVQASVITGKGVQALMGTFDTQIKGAQMVMRQALQRITGMCFEYDELWWAHETKTINGTTTGASFQFDYVPAVDINGRYDCTVTYGFAAGMDPSQSIVTMLQLQGAGLVAKETVQENLPFDVDAVQEQRRIDIETAREALKQGVFSIVQNAGQLALQGADPMPFIKMASDSINNLENGQTLEAAVSAALQAMEDAQQQAAQAAAEQQQAQQPPDQSGGAPDDGSGGPPGGASPLNPAQAATMGQPAGTQPTIDQMIAGFRGNASNPVNQAVVRRTVGTGIQ